MELSEKTRAVCRANYDINCSACPIRKECVLDTPVHLTQEALDHWRGKINETAEGVKL
jgi:hypothetical protein